MSNVLLKGGKVPQKENTGTAMDRFRRRVNGGNAENVDFRPMENDTQSLSGAPEEIKHDWTIQELIGKMKENQK